jgi:hypothetical protein
MGVGMGLHPFGDPTIRDEFSVEVLDIDPGEFHVYAAEWTPEHVAFFVDYRLVKTVGQSPGLSHASHARHLRVPRRRAGGTIGASVSQAV